MKKEFKIIAQLIENNTRVLDVGCGDGTLMKHLKDNKSIDTRGLEISKNNVQTCIGKGLAVIEGNAEKDLSQFANQSFDYVILSQTLQAMVKPKKVLLELLRIGSKAIVSFPNFGHWKIRLQLLLTGKMPVTESLPYAWYDTPNIHFFTIQDFQNLCIDLNIVIEKSIGLSTKGKQFDIPLGISGANLFTLEAIFLLSYRTYEPIKLKSSKKSFVKNFCLLKSFFFNIFSW